MSNKGKLILFVGVENAGRSQMAEVFATSLGLVTFSAGTNPSAIVHPTVIGAMREKGYDLSRNKPKLLTPEIIDRAGLIITIGCAPEQLCPRPILNQIRSKLVSWELQDPKGKSFNDVRKIRDEIEKKVKELAEG